MPTVGYAWFRNLAKLLTIALAFGLIFYLVQTRNPNSTQLVGKWKVDRLIKNKDTLKSDAWLKDSTAWKNVYIEERTDIIFCPNPYVCDMGRSLWMDYYYDSSKHNIQLVYWKDDKPVDTANVAVSNYNGKSMLWKTIFHKDTLQLQLTKEDKKK